MLITLVRLVGAWMALYGFFYGFHFAYLLKSPVMPLGMFLAALPALVSLVFGITVMIRAPRIAGRSSDDGRVVITDMLPSGLILLGVYWGGMGAFSAVANMPFLIKQFDQSRIDVLGEAWFWHTLSPGLQMGVGIVLMVIGSRMRCRQKMIEQVTGVEPR